MLSFFLSDANFWFSCALGIVAALFVMEVVGTLMGVSLLGLADDQVDFDADADASAGSLTALASWLSLDRLTLMVWLVILLTSFGIIGILTNIVSQSAIGGHFPVFIVVTISVIAALIITARLGGVIARLLPKHESSATSSEQLVGSVGHITVGTARAASPAEAKFLDAFEQPHYLLVEPIEPKDIFQQGDKVVLVKKQHHSWLATRYIEL